MRLPKDILKALATYKGCLHWVDSINGYAWFTGHAFRNWIDDSIVRLTEDDISTLGSCLGL